MVPILRSVPTQLTIGSVRYGPNRPVMTDLVHLDHKFLKMYSLHETDPVNPANWLRVMCGC